MDASEASLDDLIKQASQVVCELYPMIKRDMLVLDMQEETDHSILVLLTELRMDVCFMLLNLEVSYRSLLAAESGVEKRIHLKNLMADMHECYKLLYGYGNARNHSIWAKMGSELLSLSENCPDQMYDSLKCVHDTITSVVLRLAGSDTDKENRDLTYHYDDDLLCVYQSLLEAYDEEGITCRLLSFIDLLHNVLVFCQLLEKVEVVNGYTIPKVDDKIRIQFFFHSLFAGTLRKNDKLIESLGCIVAGAMAVDDAARLKKGMAKMMSLWDEKVPGVEFPEVIDMSILANTHLLIQIMLVDLSAIIRAYLGCGGEYEYPLTLRRLTITRVSAMSHLYGYNSNEREKSLWSFIEKMIPMSEEGLVKDFYDIQKELESLIVLSDKENRQLFAHLAVKGKSNVPEIVKKLEGINPVAEIRKAEKLIKVTTRIQVLLSNLMDKLAIEAHAKAESSMERLKAQIARIQALSKEESCPVEIRRKLNEQMNYIESIMAKL